MLRSNVPAFTKGLVTGNQFSLRKHLNHLDNQGFGGAISLLDSPDCNNCTLDLLSQVTGQERLDINRRDLSFAFPYPRVGRFGEHVQGVARLRDWNGLGRMVVTTNNHDDSFFLGFQDIIDAEEALLSKKEKLRDTISFDIRNVIAYGNHNHPGGIQTQGDLIAIPMEEPRSGKHAAIYFVKVEGNQASYVQTHWLNGSQGEPYQKEESKAEAVGFAKLNSLNYLMAVYHGGRGIWFYQSDRPTLDATTKWTFINFLNPRRGYGAPTDDKFVGASGGINFVTDCSGDLYLLALHGTSDTPLRGEYEALQVFKVDRDLNGKITLTKKAQQKDELGPGAILHRSFRWAGGSYVSRKGQLAVFNTERRRRLGDSDAVDGEVYLGKW